MHSFELNNCCVCKKQLAPDDFDGICCDCDCDNEEVAENQEYDNVDLDRYESR